VGVGVCPSLVGSIFLTLVGQIARPITHLEAQSVEIAVLLTQLLKGEAYRWMPLVAVTFKLLKTTLTSVPIL
jgi:hypothetical protein